MSESFAGITVPPGDPVSLRSTSSSVAAVRTKMSWTAAAVRAIPGQAPSWAGGASAAHAGECEASATLTEESAQALGNGGQAIGRYADELELAQRRARQAIERARDAQRRIDAASAALPKASSASTALADAQADLAAAQREGALAEEAASTAARALVGALGDRACVPGERVWDAAGPLRLFGDAAANAAEHGGWAMGGLSRSFVDPYFRQGGPVAGHWRATPGGGRTWVRPHTRSGTWVSGYARETGASRRWTTASRWGQRAGAVLAYGGAFGDQWFEDGVRRDLSTTDRVGRATGASAYVGTASLGGAALGAKGGMALGAGIGTFICPGIGTAVGGAIGAGVGALAGGAGGAWLADRLTPVKEFFVDGGEAIANGVVDGVEAIGGGAQDAWNATRGARETVVDVTTAPFRAVGDLLPW